MASTKPARAVPSYEFMPQVLAWFGFASCVTPSSRPCCKGDYKDPVAADEELICIASLPVAQAIRSTRTSTDVDDECDPELGLVHRSVACAFPLGKLPSMSTLPSDVETSSICSDNDGGESSMGATGSPEESTTPLSNPVRPGGEKLVGSQGKLVRIILPTAEKKFSMSIYLPRDYEESSMGATGSASECSTPRSDPAPSWGESLVGGHRVWPGMRLPIAKKKPNMACRSLGGLRRQLVCIRLPTSKKKPNLADRRLGGFGQRVCTRLPMTKSKPNMAGRS